MRFEQVLRSFLCLFFLVAFVFVAEGRRKSYLKTGSWEDLPAEGLKFKNLRHAKPNPLPPVSVIPLEERWKNKKTVRKVEAYIPREAWMRDQYVGRWTNDLGSLTIFKVSLPVPEDMHIILDKFVTKKEYDTWKASVPKDWGKENIVKWLEYLCEKKINPKPVEIKKGRCNIFRYTMAGNFGFNELFLVDDPKTPCRRYVFRYEAANLSDYDRSLKTVIQSAKSLVLSSPGKSESKQLLTRKSIKKENKSEEYKASLERVKKNIKNLQDWWYIETENYILASNIRKKKMINDMQTHIERCRKVYEKVFPLKHPMKEVSVIKVFQRRNEYTDYIGGRWGKDSIGLWMSNKKELAVSPLSSTKSRVSRAQMLLTLYHEGFHQYIFYAGNGINSSVWFNEGHAALFEGFEFKGKAKYELGLSERRYNSFARTGLNASESELQALIKKDYGQFYAPDTIDRNYNLAWALVYFLRKGALLMKKMEYARIPEKYYDSFCKSGNERKATEDAWAGIDMGKFTADLNAFWSSKRLIKRSENLDLEKILARLRKKN